MKIPNWYLPMFPTLRIVLHPMLLIGLTSSFFYYFIHTHYQDRIVSYSNLEKYLVERSWRKADEETSVLINKLILIRIDREHFWGYSKFDIGAAARHNLMSPKNPPCDMLTQIDSLWLKYSDNYYGFTPQSNIANTLFLKKSSLNEISNVDIDVFMKKVRFDRFKNQNIYQEADNPRKHIGMLPSDLWFKKNSAHYLSPILLLKNYKLCIKRGN